MFHLLYLDLIACRLIVHLLNIQGVRTAVGASSTVATSSTSLPLQQNQAASLRGISSACPIRMDNEACQMKGLYVPSSSAYDVSSSGRSQSSHMLGVEVEVDGQDDPLIGVSVDTVSVRQVRESLLGSASDFYLVSVSK